MYAGDGTVLAGSSPLARGLLVARAVADGRAGIIPARAGFTTATATARVSPWDHPRSRGVYSSSLARVVDRSGSSPLARGLPPPTHLRDFRPGSSPLARGLLAAIRSDHTLGGIIPARAGFTPHPRPPSGALADHPRSRGVYIAAGGRIRVRQGSSPLARGLRHGDGARPPGVGIIPARAGFTGTRAGPSADRRDHPRSRGVYDTGAALTAPAGGSSPLARGLLPRKRVIHRTMGIIPARAGFTFPAPGRLRSWRDHPRSRGVYPPTVAPASPWPWIIPARAGFTHRGRRPCTARADHPRSRGVYWPRSSRSLSPRGSSPLARGLRETLAASGEGQRIIPARAGFTTSRTTRSNDGRDHPRSRGVYPSASSTSPGTAGSSPLARGLPAGAPRE